MLFLASQTAVWAASLLVLYTFDVKWISFTTLVEFFVVVVEVLFEFPAVTGMGFSILRLQDSGEGVPFIGTWGFQ